MKRLPVNVSRNNDQIVITAPWPGLEPANVRIEVRGRRWSPSPRGAVTMSKVGTAKGQRVRHVGRELRAEAS